MPKASRSQALDRVRISDLAGRIHSRMRKLRLTQTQLSERCSMECAQLSENDERPSLSRERISKILMNRHDKPLKTAARGLSQAEFMILARVLRVSVEWLRGDGRKEDPVIWDVLAEPQRGIHLLHLLEEYEDRSREVRVWSEYPLCSFMTEEFMFAFHRIHFGQMDALGATKDRNHLVEFFNKAGKARRKRVLQSNRPYTLTNLVYEKEMTGIARGERAYKTISRQVRKRCLEYLCEVLADSSLKMNLVIVRDAGKDAIKAALHDYETLGVMDDLFSLWNYHSGSIAWSEHPRRVRHHLSLLNELSGHALCADNEEAIEYLKQISEL